MIPHPREGDARRKLLASSTRQATYLTVVSICGLAAVLLVFSLTPWGQTLDRLVVWPTLFLAVAAILGEVRPIRLIRNQVLQTLSTSAPFVLALVATCGVGVALLVQLTASLADDLHQRRSPTKSLFNTAQYALSVVAARAVYAWLASVPFFGAPQGFDAHRILPLLAGGVAMIGTNWILVAGIVSLSSSQRLWVVLREDFRDFLVTNVVLLTVGGIAAVTTSDGVGALALLGAPVVAAHLFAAAAARHAYAATHDSLTGLGNRGQLHFELVRALAAAEQGKSEGPGLVLIDLDHFKDINDTLGHPFGDQILRRVADELVAAAPDNASVHRLGGDEYAVIVRGDLAQTQRVAHELLASLDNPVKVESIELLIRASAGVAIAPQHGQDVDTLMKNVDVALYHAKLERDGTSTYSPEFDINTLERLQVLADLRTALETNGLHVVFQPQVDLETGRTVAVEALARWDHPRRGMIPPDHFIPLAESSGLIVPLTAFVLDCSLRELAKWRTLGYDLRMSVNLSARLLSDLGLPNQVAAALAQHNIPAQQMVLEVTETGILMDSARAALVVRALRELGVEISIDDYGTGNASLNYLKRLEIDELKVDRSFVSNIGTDAHDLIIVRSTISLARALGLRVVAEGIEDQPTSDSLRELGCDIGQGYHLGRPVAPETIEARLEGERRAAATSPTAGD